LLISSFIFTIQFLLFCCYELDLELKKSNVWQGSENLTTVIGGEEEGDCEFQFKAGRFLLHLVVFLLSSVRFSCSSIFSLPHSSVVASCSSFFFNISSSGEEHETRAVNSAVNSDSDHAMQVDPAPHRERHN